MSDNDIDKAAQKALAQQLIDTILNHDLETGEESLINKCIPLINDGAYLAYIDENEMTALDWAKLFGHETLHLVMCRTISDHPYIERSRKRSILNDEFDRATDPAIRNELSRYWKEATISNFERDVLHKEDIPPTPPPSAGDQPQPPPAP